MTPGALAVPARPATAPSPGDAAGPALGRPLLVAVALAVLTTASGLVPGVPVLLDLLVIVAVTRVLLRSAGGTAHPSAWRWYAASVALGGGGAALAAVLVPWGQTALGSIPGQLLVVLAIGRMLDRRSLLAARGQLATSLLLFVIGDLLTVHSFYRLTIAGTGLLSVQQTVTLFALLSCVALGTGAALLMLSVSHGRMRRVAGLVLAAQCCASVAAALSAVSTDTGSLHVLASGAGGASVLGLGLLVIAGRTDCPDTGCSRQAQRPSPSAMGSLLPHGTALVGGSLLLVSVPVTGGLTVIGSILGLLGLGVLFVHQTANWRAQQQLTAALQRSEACFRTLVRGSADPVLIVDDRLRVRWVSPAITDLLGLDPLATVGRSLADAVHPADAPGLLAALSDTHDGATRTRTARVRHVDGRWRLIQSQVRDLRSDPDVGALVLYCRDVTATPPQPSSPDVLSYFSSTDPATGLPNRSALTHRLGSTLRGRSVRSTSLVVLGVDGLPDGDDAVGLRELTTRFARVLRGHDWLARAGVSEFAVLVTGTTADAEVVATRLVAAVEPVVLPAGTLRLTAAAGVLQLSAGIDAGEALRRGDLALRSARAAGPGRVRRHSEALRIAQDREETLRADLGTALAEGQLHLVYQPVVDLALHRATSVEALLRWRHPVYGAVSPAEFVPLAEESALINELGRWVLAQATATLAGLPFADLGVAVNVSARHVRSGELVTDVLGALEASGLPASRLVLEITESVLLDDDHVTDDLAALRRLGVRIAVDDFGTGWSSLAYLVALPIDVLKMDRQFLADLEGDAQRQALCSSVLHLGNSLGLAIVVEGVETPAELQLLGDMGHRYIQGFLLARPMEAETLGTWLAVLDSDVAAVVGAARTEGPV